MTSHLSAQKPPTSSGKRLPPIFVDIPPPKTSLPGRRVVGVASFEDTALDYLRILTGNSGAEFRDGQLEAIGVVAVDRGRALVVQRTGWGKSAVYFIATKLLREEGLGPTVIVSPLLVLMRNQMEMADRLGIRAYNAAGEHVLPTAIEGTAGLAPQCFEQTVGELVMRERRTIHGVSFAAARKFSGERDFIDRFVCRNGNAPLVATTAF